MFTSTKEVLLHLWDELEVTQTDEQETIIASSDSSNYQLSDSNMNYLKSLIANVIQIIVFFLSLIDRELNTDLYIKLVICLP